MSAPTWTVQPNVHKHSAKPWQIVSPYGYRGDTFRTRDKAEKAARLANEQMPNSELRVEVGR